MIGWSPAPMTVVVLVLFAAACLGAWWNPAWNQKSKGEGEDGK